MMQDDSLTHMGNQIATFFDSMPDRQEALVELATHLKKFWDPRMRRELLARIDAGSVTAMHPMLLLAANQHRELLE